MSEKMVLGTTRVPLEIGPGLTQFEMALTHQRAASPTSRLFLNFEKMISADQNTSDFSVYLNLPENAAPEKYPELFAGTLPMFGLYESSLKGAHHQGLGLYKRLEVTQLLNRLTALSSWNSKTLTVSLVPLTTLKGTIHVDRITLTAD